MTRYLIVYVEDSMTETLAVAIARTGGVEEVVEVPDGQFPVTVPEEET
jgi:hypothetical protein